MVSNELVVYVAGDRTPFTYVLHKLEEQTALAQVHEWARVEQNPRRISRERGHQSGVSAAGTIPTLSTSSRAVSTSRRMIVARRSMSMIPAA